jgi:hypothetical protein
VDVDPPLSDGAHYMREDMSLEGYRHLLAVGALTCIDCTSCIQITLVVLWHVAEELVASNHATLHDIRCACSSNASVHSYTACS